MKVEVITIGDELLIGQIVDTNSQWIGTKLNINGFYSLQFTSIGDEIELILRTLKNAEEHADIILITGGLGPTKDDITKNTLCKYFNSKLVPDHDILSRLTAYFAGRGLKITDENKKQALVPDNCTVIPNKQGSASGMWFEKNGKVFVSMPGVPYEMKAMMSEEVIPRLRKKYKTPEIRHKTVLTQGIGESRLEEIISGWVNELPESLKISYLPAVGRVRLRISGSSEKGVMNIIDREVEKLLPLIKTYHYGFDDDTLESVLGNLLRINGLSIATAESCTGGYLSHLITSVPGCSDYFLGSMITYHNDLKESWADVHPSIIEKYGAVSRETVEAMAKGVRMRSKADYSITTSGIAGPGGGTIDKPIGTVWLGFSGKNGEQSHKLQLGANRLRNIEMSSLTALNFMRNIILKDIKAK